jgi:hypothetical protein
VVKVNTIPLSEPYLFSLIEGMHYGLEAGKLTHARSFLRWMGLRRWSLKGL